MTSADLDNLEQAIEKQMKDINASKEDVRKTNIILNGEGIHSTTPLAP